MEPSGWMCVLLGFSLASVKPFLVCSSSSLLEWGCLCYCVLEVFKFSFLKRDSQLRVYDKSQKRRWTFEQSWDYQDFGDSSSCFECSFHYEMAWSFRSQGKIMVWIWNVLLGQACILNAQCQASEVELPGQKLVTVGWLLKVTPSLGSDWTLLPICCQVSNTLPQTSITMNSSRLSPVMDSSCLKVWTQMNIFSLVSVSMNTLSTWGWTYDSPISASWELGTRWTPIPLDWLLLALRAVKNPPNSFL